MYDEFLVCVFCCFEADGTVIITNHHIALDHYKDSMSTCYKNKEEVGKVIILSITQKGLYV